MRFLAFIGDMVRASNLSYKDLPELEVKELSKEVGHCHGEEADDEVA